jgi:hypothetical protein
MSGYSYAAQQVAHLPAPAPGPYGQMAHGAGGRGPGPVLPDPPNPGSGGSAGTYIIGGPSVAAVAAGAASDAGRTTHSSGHGSQRARVVAVYVPDGRGGWMRHTQGVLDVEFPADQPTPLLVLRGRDGQAVGEYPIDSETIFSHDVTQYVLATRATNTWTFSFQDATHCQRVWAEIRRSQQLVAQLTDAAALRFWALSKARPCASLSLLRSVALTRQAARRGRCAAARVHGRAVGVL